METPVFRKIIEDLKKTLKSATKHEFFSKENKMHALLYNSITIMSLEWCGNFPKDTEECRALANIENAWENMRKAEDAVPEKVFDKYYGINKSRMTKKETLIYDAYEDACNKYLEARDTIIELFCKAYAEDF